MLDQDELRARLAGLQAVVSPTAGSTVLERAIAGDANHIGLAQLVGAKVVFHDTDARRNPSGLPDILMIVGHTFYLIECKPNGRGKLKDGQLAWQEALAGVKEIVHGVLMPTDYEAFVKEVMAQSLADEGATAETTTGE